MQEVGSSLPGHVEKSAEAKDLLLMKSYAIFKGIREQDLDKLIDASDRYLFHKSSVLDPRTLQPGSFLIVISGSVILSVPGTMGLIGEFDKGSFLGLTEASLGEKIMWEIKTKEAPTVIYYVQFQVTFSDISASKGFLIFTILTQSGLIMINKCSILQRPNF